MSAFDDLRNGLEIIKDQAASAQSDAGRLLSRAMTAERELGEARAEVERLREASRRRDREFDRLHLVRAALSGLISNLDRQGSGPSYTIKTKTMDVLRAALSEHHGRST